MRIFKITLVNKRKERASKYKCIIRYNFNYCKILNDFEKGFTFFIIHFCEQFSFMMNIVIL